jgi:formate hydrogenlyase subunit 6/NADH:ubiquinone oxidoreductase subunit I
MKKPGKMVDEVLRAAVRKPATIRYPFVRIEMPDKFRGKLKFYADKCVGCKACMRDCPSNAITINKVGDKRFEAVFDLDKCIYCAQCVDSCPKKALEATREYELAQLDRAKLKVIFHADPPKAADAGAAQKGAEDKPA